MNYIKRILAPPTEYAKFEAPFPFKKVLIGTNGNEVQISLEKNTDLMFLGRNIGASCIEIEFPSTIKYFYFYNAADSNAVYSVLVEEWGN
jgi:hypothetical protein|nr:MAG TPA: hypothetical protein [Caudoviricetes sp.]